jgi:heme-degrading monooxygenase HmoA
MKGRVAGSLHPGAIVVLSRFTVANNMADEVRAAFQQRPHLVDDAPGFLGMEVMNPMGEPAEIWLVTRWQDEQSYYKWHQGHQYQASHEGIPKGLKLVPGSTEIRVFEVFSN